MDTFNIPLFPLQTVLFPGGPLPLRIFEPRYLDMVSRSLKSETPFGVCLIRDGKEVGEAAIPYDIGTLANIVDWHRLPDGLLGIVAEGGDRFSIDSISVEPNHLLNGQVAIIPEDPVENIGPEHESLVNLLREVIREAGLVYETMEYRFSDASWVSFRLAELLPLEPALKQVLLETSSPRDRLNRIRTVVDQLTQD